MFGTLDIHLQNLLGMEWATGEFLTDVNVDSNYVTQVALYTLIETRTHYSGTIFFIVCNNFFMGWMIHSCDLFL